MQYKSRQWKSWRLKLLVRQMLHKVEKDWELMSEFDKDELIRKKIIREL